MEKNEIIIDKQKKELIDQKVNHIYLDLLKKYQ